MALIASLLGCPQARDAAPVTVDHAFAEALLGDADTPNDVDAARAAVDPAWRALSLYAQCPPSDLVEAVAAPVFAALLVCAERDAVRLLGEHLYVASGHPRARACSRRLQRELEALAAFYTGLPGNRHTQICETLDLLRANTPRA